MKQQYRYYDLCNKLRSQSSAYHSIPVNNNRPSNELCNEKRSPRLSYDIPARSESNHRGEKVREISFPIKRESLVHTLSNNLTATLVLCQLLRQQAAPQIDMEMFDRNLLNFKYFLSTSKEAVKTKLEDFRGRIKQ